MLVRIFASSIFLQKENEVRAAIVTARRTSACQIDVSCAPSQDDSILAYKKEAHSGTRYGD